MANNNALTLKRLCDSVTNTFLKASHYSHNLRGGRIFFAGTEECDNPFRYGLNPDFLVVKKDQRHGDPKGMILIQCQKTRRLMRREADKFILLGAHNHDVRNVPSMKTLGLT